LLGDKDLALVYLKRVMANAAKVNTKRVYAYSYLSLGKYFDFLNQKDSAVYYYKKVINNEEQFRFLSGTIYPAKKIYEYYKSIGNTDSALKYNELELMAVDSTMNIKKITQLQNMSFEEELRQQEIDQARSEYASKIKIYILSTGLAVLLLIGIILIRNNRHKQKAYALLQRQKQETDNQKQKVEITLEELKSTQSQLIQSEKMASLGELTAGIAHEIQNPLNFVNNFSEVNKELLVEMKDEMDKGNIEDAKEIANDVIDNSEKINHHGKRAGDIVKGMLQHSRSSTGVKEPTDINALADEYLRLSYHGLRAKDKDFNATMKTDFDESIGKVNIIPQDIGRVLLNLYNNAFYACTERSRASAGSAGQTYEPTVSVTTKKSENHVVITVSDNGNGIPEKVKDKIFQPFFTTKPTGQGTGLGLSLSYDIVKAHGGEIKVETIEGKGTKFIIIISA
jgi:signal transduction histidine kinase